MAETFIGLEGMCGPDGETESIKKKIVKQKKMKEALIKLWTGTF